MITTKYGIMEGIDCGSHMEYRGVPYAKAPVGELRWRAPQQPEAFEGIYQATAFKNKAPQENQPGPPWDKDFYDDPSYDIPISEDCLYLHIWTPKEGKDLPVAMWFHGGAFMGGSSYEKEFDGAAFCERGVIYISVEYRCNVFGFLAHPWLTEEAGTSGNYGMLDQIAAIDWVRENIAAFGGDPDNITVFGQSAGAMSIQTLISSPLTRGKIARAIMQSGGSYGEGLHRDIPLQEQEGYGESFAEVTGVANLEEMRALSMEAVLDAIGPFFGKVMPITKGLFLTPTMDGQLLTDGYYALMDKGEIADIPYMIGSNKDDMLAEVLSKGSVDFSKKLDELGRKPAYVYQFNRDLPGDDLGAWHSAELWYMMGTQDRCWRPWEEQDRKLSAKMLDYWTNFMKSGDPNGAGLAEWKPCSMADPFVMNLQ